MTEQEQRCAIAKACGWDLDPPKARNWKSRGKFVNGPGGVPGMVFVHSIPDYFNDLNAMHEAHKTLEPDEQTEFVRWLRVVVLQSPVGISHPGQLINTTAAQRAEAFLKTLNLWKP